LFKKKVTVILLSIFIIISTLAFPNITVKVFSTNGWQQNATSNYYINGDKATNWILSKGKWYYLGSNGGMVAGTWINYNNKIYYLNRDGDMAIGWILSKVTGMWYYLNPKGEMVVSSWVNCNGKFYYLSHDGDMAVSTTTPDGYIVGANGSWNGTRVIKQNLRIGLVKYINNRLE